MFHMNIASLGLHKEELEAALSLLEVDFDIIHHFGITDAMTVCPTETKESNNISLLLHFLFISQHIVRRTLHK